MLAEKHDLNYDLGLTLTRVVFKFMWIVGRQTIQEQFNFNKSCI